MNSYFFFGFHIFIAFNVSFMYHLYIEISLNSIKKLVLKSYFSKSDKVLKIFLIGINFQCYLFKLIFNK